MLLSGWGHLPPDPKYFVLQSKQPHCEKIVMFFNKLIKLSYQLGFLYLKNYIYIVQELYIHDIQTCLAVSADCNHK